MRFQEGYKAAEGCPEVILDETIFKRIKANLECFIGDTICVQGIDMHNVAYLSEGKFNGFYENAEEAKTKKLPEFAISAEIEAFGEHIFRFGSKRGEERIARVVVHNHPGFNENERNGIYFDNTKVLEEWHNLLRKDDVYFTKESYKYFTEKYGLSDHNWKPWHEQDKFKTELSSAR